MSESVSNALMLTGGEEVTETVKFVAIFDKFFDILNVSNFTNGTRKRKRFQHPYRGADDFRLDVRLVGILNRNHVIISQWLKEVFLPYLDQWESNVQAWKGFEGEKAQQEQMMLSAET